MTFASNSSFPSLNLGVPTNSFFDESNLPSAYMELLSISILMYSDDSSMPVVFTLAVP